MMDLSALHVLSLYYQGIEPHNIAMNLGISTNEIFKIIRRNKTMSQVHFSTFSKQRYVENANFCAHIKAQNALEPFAGNRRQYPGSITNDKYVGGSDFNLDANVFMQKMIDTHGQYAFDLVDVDPMGCSAYYFDNAIKLAKRGIIVFVGDLQFFRRFKSHIPNHYLGMDPDDYSVNMVSSWYVGRAEDLGRDIYLYKTLLYPGEVAAKLYYKVRGNCEEETLI